jgi:hypothetical protein
MKIIFKENVRLGCIKSRRGLLTTDVVAFEKGDMLDVFDAIIRHNKSQNIVVHANVQWEKDDWEYIACLGTSHYPRAQWYLLPETHLETSLTEPHDMGARDENQA